MQTTATFICTSFSEWLLKFIEKKYIYASQLLESFANKMLVLEIYYA